MQTVNTSIRLRRSRKKKQFCGGHLQYVGSVGSVVNVITVASTRVVCAIDGRTDHFGFQRGFRWAGGS